MSNPIQIEKRFSKGICIILVTAVLPFCVSAAGCLGSPMPVAEPPENPPELRTDPAGQPVMIAPSDGDE